jgi:hypothetical protein
MEDSNGNYTIPIHREYDDGGNNVYLMIKG